MLEMKRGKGVIKKGDKTINAFVIMFLCKER